TGSRPRCVACTRAGGAPLVHQSHPLAPMARTKLYRSLSPTASGPVIEAVAISGHSVASIDLTCSGLSFGSGSGSLSPLKLKSPVTKPVCMCFHLLLLLLLLPPSE